MKKILIMILVLSFLLAGCYYPMYDHEDRPIKTEEQGRKYIDYQEGRTSLEDYENFIIENDIYE